MTRTLAPNASGASGLVTGLTLATQLLRQSGSQSRSVSAGCDLFTPPLQNSTRQALVSSRPFAEPWRSCSSCEFS